MCEHCRGIRTWKKFNAQRDDLACIEYIRQKLMELEQQGVMELFAGDCPLEDADAVLGVKPHYTVCRYMRWRCCGVLYFVGACIRGAPVFRQVEDIKKENLDTRLWGRCGTYYSQKKDKGGTTNVYQQILGQLHWGFRRQPESCGLFGGPEERGDSPQ